MILSRPSRISNSRPHQRVSLRVKNPLIQTDHIFVRKDEEKVLERLGQPEALHVILELHLFPSHVFNRRKRLARLGRVPNRRPHGPRNVTELLVTSDAVEDKYALDGFRAEEVCPVAGLET